MAPSYEFLTKSFLPVMRAMGCEVQSHLDEYGFYPAGGGQWQAQIKPTASLRYLHLDYAHEKQKLKAVVISSRVPRHVADRELKQALNKCALEEHATEICEVKSVGPGNMLSLQFVQGKFIRVFDAFGQKTSVLKELRIKQ